MYSLGIHTRLAQGDPPTMIENITPVALGWRRSIRALGGYWLGSFTITQESLTRYELLKYYTDYLGCHVSERSFGSRTWEGLILEMTLTQGGAQYRRTLDREWWHNKVRVAFRQDGQRENTGWATLQESVDMYGAMEYMDVIGETVTATANDLRDTHLADFGWPRSRLVGNVRLGQAFQGSKVDTLDVIVGGYVATFNWIHRTTSIWATAASTAIVTLVNASEFIVPGRIETNTLAVDLDCTNPQRLWNLAEDVIVHGDASANRWVGGVYNDRMFNYNPAATQIGFFIQNGQLINHAGAPLSPSLVTPDFIVRDMEAPAAVIPSGGNVWDDPKNAWITEVEFVAPDGLVLKPSGFEDVQILQEGLR